MSMNIGYNNLAANYTILQNQMPIDEALLLKAAGADGVISQSEASQSLGSVLLTNNQTHQTLSLANTMQMNGLSGIILDKPDSSPSSMISLDATPAAKVLSEKKPTPLATVAAGFDTTQNGKPIDPAVLAKAAGSDGILTVEEATQLKGVMCKNKKTGEVLPIAECMAKNGVGAISINANAVPLATVAAGFDTTQNGKPIDPAVLAKAAGADGVLTQAEAAKLKGVMCKNKKTGEVLPIAECMIKNKVPAINLNANVKLSSVPLATVAAGFDTTQNGKPIDPAVLTKAAGADGILTIAEASKLKGAMCKNKKTGEVLPIAECMAKNGVPCINLRAVNAPGTVINTPIPANGGADAITGSATTLPSLMVGMISMMQSMLQMIQMFMLQLTH
jgi:hypothetical protein